jgi:hypothetical protein
MARWQRIKLEELVLQNVEEATLDKSNAAIENCYVTENGGISRFPMLNDFVSLQGNSPTYLEKWRGDLHAVSGGQVYRIQLDGTVENLTGFSVAGGKRTTFAQTENELLMAAGGAIVKLDGETTEKLSDDAPVTTHIGFVSGYVLAIEPDSGRFFHSAAGVYDSWDPLDLFTAEGKPDDLVALIVTEFSELMLAGTDSIEQFDPVTSGDRPFFRRWVLGAGLSAPYTLISVDNRVWGLNSEREWVAFSTQLGDIASLAIQNKLESLDDITDMWATELPISGHRFMVIQAPYATNIYGTEGVTFLYDYQQQRWGNLFSWDNNAGVPARWEGWSTEEVNGRRFVGVNGGIKELTGFASDNVERMLFRTGHLDRTGAAPMRIEKLRMRVRRGAPGNDSTTPPIISVRANKDNRGFGRWVHRSLGRDGQSDMILNFPSFGNCDTIQFEIRVTDSAPVDIKKFEMLVNDLR